MSNPEWMFAGIFADEGINGTLAEKQPELMKMIRACRKGKIKMVLTKSLSRFARNTVECLQYVRELKDLGIAVVFEKEGINTMDVNCETMIAMHSIMAQAESVSLSKNLKWSFQKRFARSEPHYVYKQWLGYDRGLDGKPVINEAEAKVVRAIFHKCLSGYSQLKIVAWLNEEKMPRKNGEYIPWGGSTVQGICHNERYCGDALCQKSYSEDCISQKRVMNYGEMRQYYIRDCHPAIISREEFMKVTELLEKHRRYYAGDNADDKFHQGTINSQYALTTLMVCGVCGNTYQRTVGKRGWVWRCAPRIKYASRYCQGTPQLLEVNVYRAVMQGICNEFPELMFVRIQNILAVPPVWMTCRSLTMCW